MQIKRLDWRGRVMVSTTAWHLVDLCSIPGLDILLFGVKNLNFNIEYCDCVSRDCVITLMLIPLHNCQNWQSQRVPLKIMYMY